MDDLNNTNPQNNPPPPATPMPSWPPPPPPPSSPIPDPVAPIPEPIPSPIPEPTPIPPLPDPPTAPPMLDPTPTWAPPVQQEPPLPQPEPTPPPTPIQTEPTPTFIPPPIPQGAPTNGIPQPETIQPSWMAATPDSVPQPQESAPTDFSHLITNNLPPETPQSAPIAENLVVPPANQTTTAENNLPAANHKCFPRWLIGLSIGLLILVAGASAYFILGIGQTKTPATTSLPAITTPKQNGVKSPPPIPTTPASPAGESSANFGELEGSGGTESQSTSAADLIRQRQQQGR